MAKIIKVKIAISFSPAEGGKIRMQRVYPPEYFAVPNYRERIIQFTREADLYYNDIISRGDNTDHCICLVPDEELAGLISSPNIEEITQEDADVLVSMWRPQAIDIDEDKINDILDKIQGSPDSPNLTVEEKNAIDPDNAEVGRNRTETFTDLLNDATEKLDAGN